MAKITDKSNYSRFGPAGERLRSGRMRWTVENQTLEAQAGDVIVTPAGQRRVTKSSATSPRGSCASTCLRERSRNRDVMLPALCL
jgi:mannose-6-phosphate isomerase-like protein (cupin superfamily)